MKKNNSLLKIIEWENGHKQKCPNCKEELKAEYNKNNDYKTEWICTTRKCKYNQQKE